jgi:8-oxo-dGTP diphosphatase
MFEQVGIGVSVILIQHNKLLLAKRQGRHGAGTWDTPGGHLEPGEKVVDCAIRETMEETRLLLPRDNIIELGFTEDFFQDEKKHYISCVVLCALNDERMRPMRAEPTKFSTEWLWFSREKLPRPLFVPVVNALDKWRQQIFTM